MFKIPTNLKEGRTAVHDADLKGYFLLRRGYGGQVDTIPHDKLMACVRMRITDSAVLGLANVYLHWSDVMFRRRDGLRHWANARLVR